MGGPPPSGGKDDDLGDVYELLEVGYEATDSEIKAAFRKGSLKWHPDKNPDDPEGAREKFDKLSRAKDLLLDAVKRADVDHKRKAKEELEHRFAQEDGKRRKLREDLEGREQAAARDDGAGVVRRESQEELKKKYVQMDFAERIKARESKHTSQQADIAMAAQAVRSETRSDIAAATVTVNYREGAVSTPDDLAKLQRSVREVLTPFGLRSLEMSESSGVARLDSREDVIRALLHCRERKRSLQFRISVVAAKEAATTEATTTADRRPAASTASTAAAAAATGGVKRDKKVPAAKGGGFGNWEADMLGGLAGLVAKQRKRPPPTNPEAS